MSNQHQHNIMTILNKYQNMVKNIGFLGCFSHFLRFFNFDWILALQTTKIWFGMKFSIFWHLWYPWGRVRSAWNKNWLHLTLWYTIGDYCYLIKDEKYVKIFVPYFKEVFTIFSLKSFPISFFLSLFYIFFVDFYEIFSLSIFIFLQLFVTIFVCFFPIF